MKVQARIVENLTRRTKRQARALTTGCLFIIEDDHRPDVTIGDTVVIEFDPNDQYATIPPVTVSGPRFVWTVGAIRDSFPDVPEAIAGQTVLWDRQEKKEVLTLFPKYSNAFCLETARQGDNPMTHLEQWFNALSDEALVSEGIPATNKAEPSKPLLPKDPEGQNGERAARIMRCLELYKSIASDEGEPDETVIKDFLSDLGHYCDRSTSMDDETLFECWASACGHYQSETASSGIQFDVV